MKKIEEKELKLNLLNQTYYNNYLFELEARNPKYFEEVMNNHLIFQTDDNYYIIIDTQKPSIDKDLWFDDEQPIPEKTEELFINYNIRKADKYRVTDKLYIYNPYTRQTKDKLAKATDSFRAAAIQRNEFIRDLTDEEEAVIKEVFAILLDNYIERLKKYYKRYADKVHCRGYWVNR